MSDPEKPQLGDLVGAKHDLKPSDTVQRNIAEADAERLIVGAAVALGQNAKAVLDEFQRGGPLASLIRAVLRVQGVEKDSFWRAIDVLDALRSEGFKGAKLRRRAADQLNRPDALGRATRNIDAESLKTYEAEAKRLRKSASLVSLYMPDDWRPSRSRAKAKSPR